jgi:hypothetical protein
LRWKGELQATSVAKPAIAPDIGCG